MSAESEATPALVKRRSVFLKLVHGLALGAGFGIGLAAVVFSVDAVKERLQRSGTHDTSEETVWPKRFTPEAKLIVERHEPRATRWNLVVLGSVRNDGADSWNLVRLEVRLFDDQAKLVGICSGSVNGPVRPASSRYFSVDCDGYERAPVPVYKTYEIEIVYASYEMKNGA